MIPNEAYNTHVSSLTVTTFVFNIPPLSLALSLMSLLRRYDSECHAAALGLRIGPVCHREARAWSSMADVSAEMLL